MAKFTVTCTSCSHEFSFERDPADWPNHPDGVRVKIECPECGAAQYTDGATEREHVEAVTAEITRQVRDEVAARLRAEAGGDVDVVAVAAHDSAAGADVASNVGDTSG